MTKCSLTEGISAAITRTLNEYANAVGEDAVAVVAYEATEAVEQLKRQSPKRQKKVGKKAQYATGWRANVENDRIGHAKAVIYNASKPQLTHLLEHGHVTRNGTERQFPDTPAKEHIAPVQQKIEEDFERRLAERIRNEG